MSASKNLTAGELMECLRMFSAGAPVAVLFDCRAAEGTVVAVEVAAHGGENQQAVVLVVE